LVAKNVGTGDELRPVWPDFLYPPYKWQYQYYYTKNDKYFCTPQVPSNLGKTGRFLDINVTFFSPESSLQCECPPSSVFWRDGTSDRPLNLPSIPITLFLNASWAVSGASRRVKWGSQSWRSRERTKVDILARQNPRRRDQYQPPMLVPLHQEDNF
jgi:hypothetical protein